MDEFILCYEYNWKNTTKISTGILFLWSYLLYAHKFTANIPNVHLKTQDDV